MSNLSKWKTRSWVWANGKRIEVVVELSIDWQKVADVMAAKAARNKSGKSKFAFGVQAKVKMP